MRYVVTGGSGYIGSRLVERLAAKEDTERITICDVRSPRAFRPKVGYEPLDVRDAARAHEIIARERPDVLIHLAFILNPIHDQEAMYEVDVNGTSNVLEAAAAAGVEQVMVTSSATAYGAFPDNPVPLTEEHPVRGLPSFEYARDKAESDRICQLWANQYPERVMTIVRPTVVFGPTVDNFIARLLTQPFVANLGGNGAPIQFVHEDDLVAALMGLLAGRHAGAFNIAADGTMTYRECAAAIGRPYVRVPRRLYWSLASLLWRLRLSEAPPGYLHFAVNPWVVSNDKIKHVLGWAPRYTTRETFEITLRARGILQAGALEQQQHTEGALEAAGADGRSGQSSAAHRA